jgi:hypothetical protein
MNFFKEKVQLPQEEMVRIAQAIAAQMQQHSEVY